MKQAYSVSLSKIIKELSLKAIYLPNDADEILIDSSDVSRPGLQMIGYYEFFDNRRIQIIGKVESSYLEKLTDDEFNKIINKFCENSPAAIVVTRGLPISERFKPYAEKYKVPLLVSNVGTSEFMAALIAFLNLQLAPRITRHGVLVEVYGEGILLLGESGVGKSETAMELVKRGHRLVADDAVEIRRVSNKSLVTVRLLYALYINHSISWTSLLRRLTYNNVLLLFFCFLCFLSLTSNFTFKISEILS